MGGWKHFNIMQEKHKKFSIYKYRSLEVTRSGTINYLKNNGFKWYTSITGIVKKKAPGNTFLHLRVSTLALFHLQHLPK